MSATSGSLQTVLQRNLSLIFPVLIITSVLVIIAPLPPLMMDLLLACNVTVAVIILLTTIHVTNPLEFSVFPAILLGTTLSRLVLNVASTRLILTGAATRGTEAAGGVIAAFGEFVAGGSAAVGVIIFIILIAIQFLVITKGATRISEVAARFALDGMPGKQMAIDADLNAGLISAEQAKARRAEISQQADFYGAMDGASKFVRGDAIAGIVITMINILGGLYIGIVQEGMSFMDAVNIFTTLTIGDGLVTQVPAFLISLAAGLIVTRTSVDSNLPADVVEQLFRHPVAMYLASGFLVALSFTGLPALPMISLGAGCGVLGVMLQSSTKKQHEEQVAAEEREQQESEKPEPTPEDHLHVDPMELDLGIGLLQLADPGRGGDLLDRVTRVRHRIAQELGMIMPKVRIRDNMRLKQLDYQVKIRSIPVAWGNIQPGKLLAINTGMATGDIQGMDTVEPAFKRPAKWIEPMHRERAEMLGFNVVEPSAVLVTHLTETVREHCSELLSRQQVHELLEHLAKDSPKVVEELVPDLLKASQVHQVLENLLRERVPIRDLEAIMETLTDYADKTKDLTILTEYVRHRLAGTICQQNRDKNRTMHVITLDPAIEDVLAAGLEFGERGMVVKLSTQVTEAVTLGLAKQLENLVKAGYPPVVICGPQIRAGLKQITSQALPKLAVLSLNEITRDTQVEARGQVPADILPTSSRGRQAAPVPQRANPKTQQAS
ncbi:flagellar biosynthesis protein FlhA [Rubinisphaera sp. JC750]|uniref:flagellar biosynthesis protein FlhA n=1 Tax=Rubinisphaera sp. JC750 TaxID=2898658 RepID=UPI001F01ECDF|nr:flagellar biosynthesis protein FlhA [Rubinisphaera sp. JC750]